MKKTSVSASALNQVYIIIFCVVITRKYLSPIYTVADRFEIGECDDNHTDEAVQTLAVSCRVHATEFSRYPGSAFHAEDSTRVPRHRGNPRRTGAPNSHRSMHEFELGLEFYLHEDIDIFPGLLRVNVSVFHTPCQHHRHGAFVLHLLSRAIATRIAKTLRVRPTIRTWLEAGPTCLR